MEKKIIIVSITDDIVDGVFGNTEDLEILFSYKDDMCDEERIVPGPAGDPEYHQLWGVEKLNEDDDFLKYYKNAAKKINSDFEKDKAQLAKWKTEFENNKKSKK